jgi:ribosomal protein S18 acetylase RimI-like enzyme
MPLPTDIRIAAASIDEAEEYWVALDQVARERKYLLFIEGPELLTTLDFVEKILEKGDCQYYAFDDDRVVGWCDILRTHRVGLEHVGHLGMGVIADYRGRGIGTALLETCIAAVVAEGVERIELEVFASNTDAIALYEKFGFVPEGRKIHARKLDGVYDDILLMAKLIPAPA